MRIVNELLLRQFGGPGPCEFCRKLVRRRECHHVYTRGAGRLDLRLNLIALCATFSGGDNCHDAAHNGAIMRCDLLAVVAAREGCNQVDIEAIVFLFRRLPRNPSEADVARELAGLNLGQRGLAERCLSEAGIRRIAG